MGRNLADESVKRYWQSVYPRGDYLKTVPGPQFTFLKADPKSDKPKAELCDTYWGTHGCDKKKGHKSAKHICRDSGTGKICHYVTELRNIGAHSLFGTVMPPDQRYAVDNAGYVWHLYG